MIKLKPVSEVAESMFKTKGFQDKAELMLRREREQTLKAIEGIIEGLHQIYDIEDKPHVSKTDLQTKLKELFNTN